MKIVKLGLLIIAIVILTGCGERCIKSHEEESKCTRFYVYSVNGTVKMIPYTVSCTKTVCDEYEAIND